MNVGVRCSIVTCSASPAMAGMSVAAVAPEPITTTFLPERSTSSGHFCGWRTSPSKSSIPSHVGL